MNKQKSTLFYTAGALLCIVIGFGIGVMWMGMRYPMLQEPTFKQFAFAYTKILNDYLDGAEPKQLINGAAEGMVASLGDPYSSYMSGEKGEAYTQSYEGQFYGIGAELRLEDGQFIITTVIKGAPAERGGLLPGDVVTAVDDVSINGKSFQELLSMIRGKEGTTITLKLNRAGEAEPIVVSLKREAIPVHTVTSELLEGNIGHITISRFAEKTAVEFKTELDKLQEKQPLNGLLLDLRSNPGGLLDPTMEIASLLIPKDKTILEVVYKNERSKISYKSKQEKEWKIPIAVLVNGQSASASEVLTAALKESAGAVVIGEKTYGKGVVQAFMPYPDGSVLSLTEAQWKTPGGKWINKEGVHPDIEVSLPDYANLRPLTLGSAMQLGSYGEDVKTLQKMLQALGFGPIYKEGLFDESTAAALLQFQISEKLEATGQFNDKTGYRLLELLRDKLHREDSQLLKGMEVLTE